MQKNHYKIKIYQKTVFNILRGRMGKEKNKFLLEVFKYVLIVSNVI